MTCDEYFSCDVEYIAKPCSGWIEESTIREGTHLANIGDIEICPYAENCYQLEDTGAFFYEKVLTGHPTERGAESQEFRVSGLDKDATVSATISLPPQSAPVCLSVKGEYW